MKALVLAGLAFVLALALVLGIRALDAAKPTVPPSAPESSAAQAMLEPGSGEPEERPAAGVVEPPFQELASGGGRQPSADVPAGTARVRGRVIDAATRTPLPPGVVALEVRQVGSSGALIEKVQLDPEGAFETRREFRTDAVDVRVYRLPRKGRLESIGLGRRHLLLEQNRLNDGTELVLEVDPGVLVFVAPVTPDGLELVAARARISAGPGWVSLVGGERPYVLFPNLHPEIEERQAATLELEGHSSEGKLTGRSTVAWRCGIHEVAIPLELEPHAFGQVVDRDGEPLEGVAVTLLPLGDRGAGGQEVARDETDGGGRFSFRSLDPIEYRLVASGSFSRSEPVRFRAAPGRNDLGRVVLPATRGAGAVRGTVIDPGAKSFGTVLLLEDLESRKRVVVRANGPTSDEPGVFAFERVPPGAYSLRSISPIGPRFEPESTSVSPPAEGIEFHVLPGPTPTFFVSVRDAGSGEVIPRFAALSSLEGQWIGGDGGTAEEELFVGEEWIVWAEGHRPARVTRKDFERAEAEGLELEEEAGELELWRAAVALERGFCQPIVFRNGDDDSLQVLSGFMPSIGPPLAGVQVFADGELAATSDADGLALVALERAPARLDHALAGWTAALDETEDGIRCVVMIRR